MSMKKYSEDKVKLKAILQGARISSSRLLHNWGPTAEKAWSPLHLSLAWRTKRRFWSDLWYLDSDCNCECTWTWIFVLGGLGYFGCRNLRVYRQIHVMCSIKLHLTCAMQCKGVGLQCNLWSRAAADARESVLSYACNFFRFHFQTRSVRRGENRKHPPPPPPTWRRPRNNVEQSFLW